MEIIVIDDLSDDDTAQIIRKLRKANIRLILNSERIGLAESIRKGIQLSTKEYVLVMDSDLTHSVNEIDAMLKVAEVFDLVSGSRFSQGGSMESKKHYIASLLYNWCLRAILKTQVQDNLGGFWLMKRNDVLSLPLNKIFYGYGDYFFRLLYLASKFQFSIVELPSAYSARRFGKSKSNFTKLLFKYSWEALRFKRSIKSLHLK